MSLEVVGGGVAIAGGKGGRDVSEHGGCDNGQGPCHPTLPAVSPHRITNACQVITRVASTRVAEVAFKYADENARSTVGAGVRVLVRRRPHIGSFTPCWERPLTPPPGCRGLQVWAVRKGSKTEAGRTP